MSRMRADRPPPTSARPRRSRSASPHASRVRHVQRDGPDGRPDECHAQALGGERQRRFECQEHHHRVDRDGLINNTKATARARRRSKGGTSTTRATWATYDVTTLIAGNGPVAIAFTSASTAGVVFRQPRGCRARAAAHRGWARRKHGAPAHQPAPARQPATGRPPSAGALPPAMAAAPSPATP